MSSNHVPASILFLVTGSRGSGKTTFCTRLVDAARESGWHVAGLISHPIFEESPSASSGARDMTARVAIEAEDLGSGATRRLAMRSESPTPGTKHWQFDRQTIDWGNTVLQSSTPCDLLVIDEMGPLEFERESGWQAGFAALDGQQYAIAVVVVRAELLAEALIRWPGANLVEIDTPEDSTRKADILVGQLF